MQVKDRASQRIIQGLDKHDFKLIDNGEVINSESSFIVKKAGVDNTSSLANKMLVLIDVSSSVSPFDTLKVKQAARALVVDENNNSKLESYEYIAFATFDDEFKPITVATDDPSQLVFTNQVDNTLLNAIDTIQRGDASTDLYGAVSLARNLLQTSPKIADTEFNNLIIITDGSDTAGSSSRPYNDNKTYAIAVGDQADITSLNYITGNNAFPIDDFDNLFDQMEQVFFEILQNIPEFYIENDEVIYNSPRRSESWQLTFELLNNQYNGSSSRSYHANNFTGGVSSYIDIHGPLVMKRFGRSLLQASTAFEPLEDDPSLSIEHK